MKLILLLYMPVVHTGYVKLLKAYRYSHIYVWGPELIARESSLRKEVRAIEPELAVTLIKKLLQKRNVFVATNDSLRNIAKAQVLVMPDDEISKRLYQDILFDCGAVAPRYENIFLRWDATNSQITHAIIPDDKIHATKIAHIVERAFDNARKSEDQWIQVGAVLFKADGSVSLSARNAHSPTQYSPSINGDPRGSFHKGDHIENSTAIHAEAALIADAARYKVQTKGQRIFVTTFPCPVCALLIARSGISELYFLRGYSMVDGAKTLRDAGVKIIQVIT